MVWVIGVFLLQDYSCIERTVSADRSVLKSVYSFPYIGTGLNIAQRVRALNGLNALKVSAEGNGAINIYSHKCLGKTRCKFFRWLTQPQLPSYSQACSFHQDHWRWSDAKKEGPDISSKHKQMVQLKLFCFHKESVTNLFKLALALLIQDIVYCIIHFLHHPPFWSDWGQDAFYKISKLWPWTEFYFS